MKAYLHTYQTDQNGLKNSFLTLSLDVIEKPLQWQLMGLMYTATGYGAKIPTQYMVRFNDKWRRVYCAIFSNIGTLYIGKRTDNLIIDIARG